MFGVVCNKHLLISSGASLFFLLIAGYGQSNFGKKGQPVVKLRVAGG
jgi:hypothetical protein